MSILDEYFTDPEFAAEMRVKPRTTKLWRDQRTGPPVTYIAGKPHYRKEAVRSWLLKREGKGLRRGAA